MTVAVRIAVVLALTFLPLLTGCSKQAPPAQPPQATAPPPAPVEPKPQRPDYEIGAMFPLSGSTMTIGAAARNGMELAILEINRSSSPFRIEATFQDSTNDVADATAIMKRLCTYDKVPLVVGEAMNHMSQALAPIANSNETVLISPISSGTELTDAGDFFFRTCVSDAVPARLLAEWMRELGVQSVGIIFVNNPWGVASKDLFAAEFAKLGGTVTAVEGSLLEDEDVTPQLTSVLASKCDAIYLPTMAVQGARIVQQIKSMEAGHTLIFGSVEHDDPLFRNLAGPSAEGVYLLRPHSFAGPTCDDFRNRYIQKYDQMPAWPAFYAYDTVRIIEQAFLAGKRTGPELREYLLNMPPYDGLTGTIKFDENGDRIAQPFVRCIIKNGEVVAADNANNSPPQSD